MDGQTLVKRARLDKWAEELYDLLELLAVVSVCMVFVFTFAVRIIGVNGESMEQTLLEKDTLIISRLTGPPKRGEIVALTKLDALGKPLVKRVIAVGGETVHINFNTGDVTVDGVVLDEPYIAERIEDFSQGDMLFPQTVPEGHVFVLGDNRNFSYDSRETGLGMVDERHILGTVLYRIFPPKRIGKP